MNWIALELGDRLAELAPLLHISDREVQSPLGDTDGLRADGDPGVVEGAQGDLQPVAHRADPPVIRNPHMIEEQLAGRAAP